MTVDVSGGELNEEDAVQNVPVAIVMARVGSDRVVNSCRRWCVCVRLGLSMQTNIVTFLPRHKGIHATQPVLHYHGLHGSNRHGGVAQLKSMAVLPDSLT